MTANMYSMTPPNRLTGSEAATLIASGSLTSVDLARSCLDRIQERPEIEAWVHLDFDLILRNAQALDAIPQAERRGRLFGVPVAIKDLFYTAGAQTISYLLGPGCTASSKPTG